MCPTCGRQSFPEDPRCAGCFGSLENVVPVTKDEGDVQTRSRQRARTRRRVIRWGVVGVVVIAIAAVFALKTYGTTRFMSAPSSGITSSAAAGNWPMVQRDPAHTGYDPTQDIAPRGELAWRFDTAAPILTTPAVVDGRLYLSTGDRRVVALDATSGELIWEHEVTGPVGSSVAVAGDLVFVGLRDSRMLALRKSTGELEWESDTDGHINSSPVVKDGVLYVGTGDYKMIAFDATTGATRWSYKAGGWIMSSPAVLEDLVAFTSQDGNLYIIDTHTGKRRLDYQISRGGTGSPVFGADKIFMTDGMGLLSAIDWEKKDPPFERISNYVKVQLFAWQILEDLPPQEGFVWGATLQGEHIVASPALAWGKVYSVSPAGSLLALDESTGERSWIFQANAGLRSSPSVLDKTVFAGDMEGQLYAIDAITGEKRWDLKIGDGRLLTPVLANGMLYVASWDGTLYAFH